MSGLVGPLAVELLYLLCAVCALALGGWLLARRKERGPAVLAKATALALTKTILNQSFERSAHDVFAQGSQAQGICYTSTEHRESVMKSQASAVSAPSPEAAPLTAAMTGLGIVCSSACVRRFCRPTSSRVASSSASSPTCDA